MSEEEAKGAEETEAVAPTPEAREAEGEEQPLSQLVNRMLAGGGGRISLAETLLYIDAMDRREDRRLRREQRPTEEKPEWAKRLEEQQAAILSRLEQTEAERREAELVEKAQAPLRAEIEKRDHTISEMQEQVKALGEKVGKPPEEQGGADIRLRDLPELDRGLGVVGLEIGKKGPESPQPPPPGVIQINIGEEIQRQVQERVMEAVKEGLFKKEEVLDEKGQLSWARVINRGLDIAEDAVQRFPLKTPEEKPIEELPKGQPEAQRTPKPTEEPAAPSTTTTSEPQLTSTTVTQELSRTEARDVQPNGPTSTEGPGERTPTEQPEAVEDEGESSPPSPSAKGRGRRRNP